MTAQEAIEVLEVFTTEKFQCLTSSEFDDAICCAIKSLEKQSKLERVIERLEEEKGIAFLTLANTGDNKYDLVYDNVMAYIDKAIEIIKEEMEN